ncbi:hypothetical protein VIBNISO65_110016 [Vibrio nigripulchritudo SO65]|nr:hypothetical protein VIBNIAM115_480010 [Vibrio nigripulchritudo AM115]CCN41850.1 hypothetical protein VIBNIFTn2_210096 [Vibrio nigripulchritudo FTn2]CCN66356.1 hypothetical protein VIBNIPon4_530146 [Vibrio nigripulchritudo POn4]CCN74447.1 hypothetical protein VIBNISO65_110016 [Vibrio nigripulchritudo SO65]
MSNTALLIGSNNYKRKLSAAVGPEIAGSASKVIFKELQYRAYCLLCAPLVINDIERVIRVRQVKQG